MRIPLVRIPDFAEDSTNTLNQHMSDTQAALADRAYGNLYQDNASTLISIASSGVNYIVTGFTACPHLRGLSSSGTSAMTCNNPGLYYITWNLSFKAQSNNQGIEGSIGINQVRQSEGAAHIVPTTANQELEIAGSGCLRMARNDYIHLFVKNHDGTGDVTVEHANLTIVKIDD